MLWGETLEYWARWQPDNVGLRFEEREYTWAELNRRADELAAGLANLGVGHGDRVGILLHNRPEYIETALACMKLGAVGVPANVRFTAPELAYVVGNADCSVLVTEDAFGGVLDRVRAERPGMPILNADDGTLDEARMPGGTPPAVEISPPDPLFICYTSGTTGDPKGAVLTHQSWHYAAQSRALQGGINLHDRVLLPFPLAFPGGLAMFMTTLWAGGQLVLERAFDPTRCLQLIQDLKITVFMAVPVIFQQLAEHPDFATTDVSSIRCASSGGAPVPVSLLQIWLDRGITMTQTYTLTEGTTAGLTLPYHEALKRVGYCGIPDLHMEAKIVDEEGNECPPGVVGEICLKGPAVMAGYWRNPEGTAAALRDGWLHTGDLGLRDEDGYFKVVDRAKDMLISGGLNVYPAEIERVLAGVKGVVEVAVIGVPDKRWGETPAVVAYTAGAPLSGEDILNACVGELADYKLPRYLVVRDEPLPRNMSGKILKRNLRDEYADLASRATPIR
jgi:fatty-acyl-CoA synthase